MQAFMVLRQFVALLWKKYEAKYVDEKNFRKMIAAVIKIQTMFRRVHMRNVKQRKQQYIAR